MYIFNSVVHFIFGFKVFQCYLSFLLTENCDFSQCTHNQQSKTKKKATQRDEHKFYPFLSCFRSNIWNLTKCLTIQNDFILLRSYLTYSTHFRFISIGFQHWKKERKKKTKQTRKRKLFYFSIFLVLLMVFGSVLMFDSHVISNFPIDIFKIEKQTDEKLNTKTMKWYYVCHVNKYQ